MTYTPEHRRARVECTNEFLEDSPVDIRSVLEDAQMPVIGSYPTLNDDAIVLVLQGAGLPPECDPATMPFVKVLFSEERYGRQRLVRVSEVELLKQSDQQPTDSVEFIARKLFQQWAANARKQSRDNWRFE